MDGDLWFRHLAQYQTVVLLGRIFAWIMLDVEDFKNTTNTKLLQHDEKIKIVLRTLFKTKKHFIARMVSALATCSIADHG